MIDGVIFDMDGLMFDTERLWDTLWEPACRELGLPLPPDMEKIYHRLYLALWWPLARQTPAFRRELRALYRQFTHAFRSRLRHHQWSLPVSPGRNFRKRREKIKTLQRQLAVFDGSWP